MALGVQKSLEVITDVEVLVVEVVDLLKSGVSLSKFGKILTIVGVVQELVADAKEALPELKEVDAAEAGKLAEASYKAVQKIVQALVVKK
jgi:hypothetical protein